jgi:hypothetical protein
VDRGAVNAQNCRHLGEGIGSPLYRWRCASMIMLLRLHFGLSSVCGSAFEVTNQDTKKDGALFSSVLQADENYSPSSFSTCTFRPGATGCIGLLGSRSFGNTTVALLRRREFGPSRDTSQGLLITKFEDVACQVG